MTQDPDTAAEPPTGPAAPSEPGAREVERVSERLGRRWVRAATEVRWIFLLALVIRAAAAAANPAILNDSVGLLAGAARVRAGGLGVLLELPQHPLPPALVALGATFADPQLVATVLSVVGGAAVVWPLHALGRRACGRHPAAAACILYAALPKAVDVASVPLAEGVFLPFFVASFAFAVAARDAGAHRGRRLLLSGLSAGVAYLCRPEALIAAPLLIGAHLLSSRGDRVRSAALVAAGFLALGAPYATALSIERARVTVTPKKDLARFAGLRTIGARAVPDAIPDAAPTAAPDGSVRDSVGAAVNGTATPPPGAPRRRTAGTWSALRGLMSAAESAFTVPVLLLVLIGSLPPGRWRRRRSRRPRALLALTGVALFAIVLRLRGGWGYGGGRHLLAAATLLLPFAGEGLFALGAVIPRVTSRRRFVIVTALLLSTPLAVRAIVRPAGEGGLSARRLGEEIARRELEAAPPGRAPHVVVASFAEPLVAYYADRRLSAAGGSAADLRLWGRFARAFDGPDFDGELVAALHEGRADWLVLDLFDRAEAAAEPPGGALARRLGASLGGRPAAAGSELVAFPVR